MAKSLVMRLQALPIPYSCASGKETLCCNAKLNPSKEVADVSFLKVSWILDSSLVRMFRGGTSCIVGPSIVQLTKE